MYFDRKITFNLNCCYLGYNEELLFLVQVDQLYVLDIAQSIVTITVQNKHYPPGNHHDSHFWKSPISRP